MAPWDDSEVDSDGGELLDWLWDLPDRYDVGYEDDQQSAGAASVRKHVRRPAGDAPEPDGAWWSEGGNDQPTISFAPIDPVDEDVDTPVPVMALAARRGSSRFNARDLAAAAALFLVVAGAIALGYSLLRGSNKPRSANLVIGNSTTTQPTSFDQSVIPPVATSASTDTTSTTVGTTTTVSSIPAFGVGVTTTTVRRTTTTTKPKPTTTTSSSTSTSTTTSTTTGSTTTSSTAVSTTTSSTPSSTTSTTKPLL